MTHSTDGQGSIVVYHRYPAGSFNPATDGVIDGIVYSSDRISLTGRAVADRFVVFQNGVRHVANLTTVGTTDTSWATTGQITLVATDFTLVPDFSAQGGEIFFGYVRANSNTAVGLQVTDHGIDNWRVEVNWQR